MGLARLSALQLLDQGLGLSAAGESVTEVDNSLGALAALAAQGAVVMQQQLPAGHAPDALGVAVAGADKGGVDVAPARAVASLRIAALRR